MVLSVLTSTAKRNGWYIHPCFSIDPWSPGPHPNWPVSLVCVKSSAETSGTYDLSAHAPLLVAWMKYHGQVLAEYASWDGWCNSNLCVAGQLAMAHQDQDFIFPRAPLAAARSGNSECDIVDGWEEIKGYVYLIPQPLARDDKQSSSQIRLLTSKSRESFG